MQNRARTFLSGILWLTAPLYPLLCLALLDYMNYRGDTALQMAFWAKRPASAACAVLAALTLFLLLTLMLRRLWLSSLILGTVAGAFGYIHYMKLTLNGDPFFPQDILMAGQAGTLTSFLSGDVPPLFWPGVLLLACWTALFFFGKLALPRPFFPRWSAAALVALMLFQNTASPQAAASLLGRFGITAMDSALQSYNYSSNGFTAAFLLNLLTARLTPPTGYTQETVEGLLSDYQTIPATAEEDFDIVLVLSESFFDPRVLVGLEFSQNPLPNYDRLTALPDTISGLLYSTATGGGTVRPEFNILTGLTTDYLGNAPTPYQYVTRPLTGYVSQLKEAGYTALAVHPYQKEFYSRASAYPHLGFDAFYGENDIESITDLSWQRGYISDEATGNAIKALADSQTQPTFLFAITMENHQPYHALSEENIHITVEAPALSQPAHEALTTFTQGLSHADALLGDLAAWVDARERPTVLVFFGDHLPTLGPSRLAYNELGYVDDSDGLTSAERQKIFSTPFLVYANRALSPSILQPGTDNVLSAYHLLGAVLTAVGQARTPYTQLLEDFYTVAPYHNIALQLPESPETAPYLRAMELIAYDRVLGKGWSVSPGH